MRILGVLRRIILLNNIRLFHFDLHKRFLRHFNISYEELVISSNKMRQKQILSVLWTFYIVLWRNEWKRWFMEIKVNCRWESVDEFALSVYRLNKSHKIREMIGWFWFMDCFVKNPWIHETIHVIKSCVNKC